MFSVPDILVLSVLALLLFGPDRLPKVMRQAGRVMRDVQRTSQSFIAEMEAAAEMPAPLPAYNEEAEPELEPAVVAEHEVSPEPANASEPNLESVPAKSPQGPAEAS